MIVLPVAALLQIRASGPPVETLIADFLCSKGEFTLNAGLTDQAIELFQESLDFAPGHARATCALGRAYHQMGDLDRAIERYNAVIETNPDEVIAYFYRGLVFHERGQFDRAIADFRQALKNGPDFQPAQKALEMTERQKRNSAPTARDS
jgi:tetratricopeptide (TPR) repeat protein